MRVPRIVIAGLAGGIIALGAAAPALAKPVAGDVTVTAAKSCGQVTLTFTNTSSATFSFDYRVDGEPGTADEVTGQPITQGPLAGTTFARRFETVDMAPGAGTVTRTVTFDEDSGDHTVVYGLQRGGEQENYLPWRGVQVGSNCEADPSPSDSPTESPTSEPTDTPTGNPTGEPTDSTSPSGSTSPSDSGSASPTTSVILAGDGTDDGGLPVTGAPLAAIGGAGAAVLAGGVLLLVIARKRRRVNG